MDCWHFLFVDINLWCLDTKDPLHQQSDLAATFGGRPHKQTWFSVRHVKLQRFRRRRQHALHLAWRRLWQENAVADQATLALGRLQTRSLKNGDLDACPHQWQQLLRPSLQILQRRRAATDPKIIGERITWHQQRGRHQCLLAGSTNCLRSGGVANPGSFVKQQLLFWQKWMSDSRRMQFCFTGICRHDVFPTFTIPVNTQQITHPCLRTFGHGVIWRSQIFIVRITE